MEDLGEDEEEGNKITNHDTDTYEVPGSRMEKVVW